MSENNFGATPIRAKSPFSIVGGEIDDFFLPDVRIGGWGPLFAAALLMSTLAAVSRWRVAKPSVATIATLTAVVGAALVLPYPWWARYAPTLAFVPILLLADGWNTASSWHQSLLRGAATAALVSNALLVGWSHFTQQAVASSQMRAQLAGLASTPAPVFLRVRDTESVRHRLTAAGIRFKEVDVLPCPESPILYSTSAYCVGSRR